MTDETNQSKAITHQECTLELNADVAEWCPLPSSIHRRLLAAGTYQLNETTQKRRGRLYVYNLNGDIKKESKLSLHCAATYDLPGIFDLKWLPGNFLKCPEHSEQHPMITAALADGSLRLLHVLNCDQDSSESVEVVEIARVESPEGGMALSLDCRYHTNSNNTAVSGGENLISSYSDGNLATHRVYST
jgi:hypothetical protein